MKTVSCTTVGVCGPGLNRALFLAGLLRACMAAMLLTTGSTALLAQGATSAGDAPIETREVATVAIDGEELFRVRGVSAYPATRRAQEVRDKILELARDETVDPTQITVNIDGDFSTIAAGDKVLLRVFDADAEIEGVERKLLAEVFAARIRAAIIEYREQRSPGLLARNSAYAAGVTAISLLLGWAWLRLFRWLNRWAIQNVQRNLDELASKSQQLFNAGQVWSLLAALLNGIKLLGLLALAYFLLNTVLGLFPWTRPAALVLFDLILNPLESMGRGFIAAIPDLAFLVVLFLVVRYILKIIRLFFVRIDLGRVQLENFDSDWAMPTYKLLRILIIAFAVVIAYPYIPGSDSLAFKGVSVFLGVIFSLGSSSVISGMLAGLTMTYRGAFKEGDRVRIGDVLGKVEDVKLMVTRIRTPKNEIVVIPNTTVLDSNIVNYSAMAREGQLILHTVVGIGYDTPWRQVEAMLLEAARRTEGLATEQAPFVLQKLLGDYAVNYELNVYCNDDTRMPQFYSALHAHIQDVFNEYGVQIMSPSYEADPEQPKVVPPEQWYAEPAIPPSGKG